MHPHFVFLAHLIIEIIPEIQDQEGVEFFGCTDEKAAIVENMSKLKDLTMLRGTTCEFSCKSGYKTMMPHRASELVCYLKNKPHILWTLINNATHTLDGEELVEEDVKIRKMVI